jgi:hypothetical protein
LRRLLDAHYSSERVKIVEEGKVRNSIDARQMWP